MATARAVGGGYILLSALLPSSFWSLYDDKGYPDGLKGEEIPLESRILAIADAYQAMTSNRPYRPALTRGQAISELRTLAGKQFDPTLVPVFICLLGRFGEPIGREGGATAAPGKLGTRQVPGSWVIPIFSGGQFRVLLRVPSSLAGSRTWRGRARRQAPGLRTA